MAAQRREHAPAVIEVGSFDGMLKSMKVLENL
jgi:hypothetical protein